MRGKVEQYHREVKQTPGIDWNRYWLGCVNVFCKERTVNQLKCTVISLICAICGCVHALDSDSVSHSVEQASAGDRISCPSQDFDKFIQIFSESKDVQMRFTKYPLKQLQLNLAAEPEPKPIVQELWRDQVLFPVMPDEAERKQKSLVLHIDDRKSNHVELILEKDDTDYKINYFFSRDSCWYLERIENWSL